MNFALLGDDRSAWPVARAIVANPQHRLLAATCLGSVEHELRDSFGDVRVLAGWEELVAEPKLDAALICGSQPTVLEGARHLAADGIPLIVFPQADQGINFAYELTLIRDQEKTFLFPVLPGRFSPAVKRLRQLISAEELGLIQLIGIDHPCEQSDEHTTGLWLTGASLHRSLLHDALLLRSMAGEYHQITCLSAGTTETGFSQATVTLKGRKVPEAIGNYQPSGSANSGWKVRIQADRGAAELTADSAGQGWTLTINGKVAVADAQAEEETASGNEVLSQFEQARQGATSASSWSEVVWGFDLLDAANRSVKKRRTIDLHFEMPSERAAFKSQMTAIGCGVLSLTLVLAIGLLIVGALFSVPATLLKIGRVIVFAPLFLFLLLQGLLLLTSPSRD